MKCIILAAGYATRLYPLTENFPKPLLDVNGKSILDYLIDDINKTKLVSEYIVVSNHKFFNIFNSWKDKRDENIIILDDGSVSNENRLGAVKDIKFAIDKLNIDDDCLVIAGDNLLSFSLSKFIDYINIHKTSCVMRFYVEDLNKLKKSGVLEIDSNDLIINMEEKPNEPQSHYCCPPFYYYLRDDIKLIDEALKDGCGYDAPGSLISWMCKHRPIHAFLMPGRRYDIGNLESYEEVKRAFKEEIK